MTAKQIEIFEAKGLTNTDELDHIIIGLHKKYGSKISIRKINVADTKNLSRQKNVVKIIKERGVSALPIILVDGKFSSVDGLRKLLTEGF